MKISIEEGTVSKLTKIFIADSSSSVGAGLTGLLYNSSGLTWYWIAEGDSSATSVTLATMTVGTWASGGFKEVDSTNMPGIYEIGIPNSALDNTSQGTVHMILKGATNMVPVPIEIQLSTGRSEPGQGAPSVSATLEGKIDYLYKAWRNKSTQTASDYKLYADDGTTVDQKSSVSDDDTTFTREEVASGP